MFLGKHKENYIKDLGFLPGVIFWSETKVSGLLVCPIFRDYLETLRMGYTSIPGTLVSDQKITPGKNSKKLLYNKTTAAETLNRI